MGHHFYGRSVSKNKAFGHERGNPVILLILLPILCGLVALVFISAAPRYAIRPLPDKADWKQTSTVERAA